MNCYNRGSISVSGGNGVTVGGITSVCATSLKNSYNYGTITKNSTGGQIGGIAGRNFSGSLKGTITNCYYSNTKTTYAYYIDGSNMSKEGNLPEATLKTYASQLGDAFVDDTENINGGYPVLKWQVEE